MDSPIGLHKTYSNFLSFRTTANMSAPFCQCNTQCIQAIVSKETPNKGRAYWKCANGKCGTFGWVDESASNMNQATTPKHQGTIQYLNQPPYKKQKFWGNNNNNHKGKQFNMPQPQPQPTDTTSGSPVLPDGVSVEDDKDTRTVRDLALNLLADRLEQQEQISKRFMEEASAFYMETTSMLLSIGEKLDQLLSQPKP